MGLGGAIGICILDQSAGFTETDPTHHTNVGYAAVSERLESMSMVSRRTFVQIGYLPSTCECLLYTLLPV